MVGILAAVANDPVHTTGINWQVVLAILLPMLGIIIALVSFLDHRNERRQTAIKEDIKESVDNLSAVLSERLETKDNVNALKVEVARLQTGITQGAAEKIERLEREIVDLRARLKGGH